MSPNAARLILIVATLTSSWLGMQIVHEMGHVVGAGLTGGTVTRIVLHPATISRTDVAPNPHPLIVVWSGPLLGGALPLFAWATAHWLQWRTAYLLRFFAAFCCIANGAYIGAAVFFPVGDAQVMRAGGTPDWWMALFGAVTVPLGLVLWNGLGPDFGIGPTARRISPAHALSMAALCAVLVTLMLALG